LVLVFLLRCAAIRWEDIYDAWLIRLQLPPTGQVVGVATPPGQEKLTEKKAQRHGSEQPLAGNPPPRRPE